MKIIFGIFLISWLMYLGGMLGVVNDLRLGGRGCRGHDPGWRAVVRVVVGAHHRGMVLCWHRNDWVLLHCCWS